MSNEYNGSKPRNNEIINSNGNALPARRESRTSDVTGALPVLNPEQMELERSRFNSYEFDHLIQSLRDLFEHDRTLASQQDTTRCGLCYLYFNENELKYRAEGYYVCVACEHSLGKQRLNMLRKQQKL